jgi:tetratricopeptide (TPR) repeat protein
MKTRAILAGPILLLLLFAIIISIQAQTTNPAGPSRRPTADAAARKQLAAYMADFHDHPEDAGLRDKIIELAKALKPAPLVPQGVRADFAKAVAQLKDASTAEEFKAAAKIFEQVALRAPWYADAYYNAASAYASAADYDSAKRNLTVYMAAVRADANTQKAEDLQLDIERQQSELRRQQDSQRFQQALQEFRKNSNDDTRKQIIKLALTLPAKPDSTEDVHEAAGRAAYAIKNASSEADFIAAAEAYGKASQLAPWVSDYYFNQGVAYEKAKRFDQAVAAFRWYLVAEPNAKDADQVRERIGGLKYAKEKAEQDRRDAAQAEQRRQEEHARNCQKFTQDVNSASDLYRSHRYDEAIELYNKSLRGPCTDHPEAGMAYAGMAAAYADKGNYQEAMKVAQKGLDLYPDYAWLNGLMGNFRWHYGDRAGACQLWRKLCNMGNQQGCSQVAQYCR